MVCTYPINYWYVRTMIQIWPMVMFHGTFRVMNYKVSPTYLSNVIAIHPKIVEWSSYWHSEYLQKRRRWNQFSFRSHHFLLFDRIISSREKLFTTLNSIPEQYRISCRGMAVNIRLKWHWVCCLISSLLER